MVWMQKCYKVAHLNWYCVFLICRGSCYKPLLDCKICCLKKFLKDLNCKASNKKTVCNCEVACILNKS